MHDDEHQICELISAWLRATSRGNLRELLKLMDEDVAFLTLGQPPMRGRDAFAAAPRGWLVRRPNRSHPPSFTSGG